MNLYTPYVVLMFAVVAVGCLSAFGTDWTEQQQQWNKQNAGYGTEPEHRFSHESGWGYFGPSAADTRLPAVSHTNISLPTLPTLPTIGETSERTKSHRPAGVEPRYGDDRFAKPHNGGKDGEQRGRASLELPQLPRIGLGDSENNPSPGDSTRKGKYLGQLSENEFATNSINNRFGAGNPYNPDSINNEFGRYGSKYSPNSATNPYATNAPKLYDSQGNYRGRLSANEYDPESISNPYGRYGSQYSAESINNPFGAGNPFASDSPSNPFGRGLSIYGEE